MEEASLLNPDNNADLLALHMTFLPKLQEQLDSFRLGWCHHRLRTETGLPTNYGFWECMIKIKKVW